ncbi:MAG: peptide chain release factor N(5)-glutamine methyltransferase [Candidatus Enteromonas sp.]|nr:peptide chain release factor N(5)-glutamine methyltransferase [Candidatus Enteromonas sp.]
MSKILEVYSHAIKLGSEHGILSQDLRVLIAADMGYSEPIDTLYHKDDEFTQESLFWEQFARLMKQEPVEYILHQCKFLDHKFYVDERVLIPRMETEELIANITERIDNYYDPRNYLVAVDVGTGSGCIAITLKSLFKNWLVSANDVSAGALEVAKKNAATYNSPIRFFEGSALQPYIKENMAVDIIVSNPPYIRNKDEVQTSVKDYEPETALYLDEDHSVYEEIFRDYKKVKKGSLLMCFEIGYDLKEYLEGLMEKYLEDYQYEFIDDLNGLPRFLFVYCA